MVTVKLGLVSSKNKPVFLKAAARSKIRDVLNHRASQCALKKCGLQVSYLALHRTVVGIV